jgi:hypothetical protein
MIFFLIVAVLAGLITIYINFQKPKQWPEPIREQPVNYQPRNIPASAPSDKSGERWQTSERGNPTFTVGPVCVTVFPQDEMWAVSLSDDELYDEDEDKEYIEYEKGYKTQADAKIAALLLFLEHVDA